MGSKSLCFKKGGGVPRTLKQKNRGEKNNGTGRERIEERLAGRVQRGQNLVFHYNSDVGGSSPKCP